jgi:hypothetical protein
MILECLGSTDRYESPISQVQPKQSFMVEKQVQHSLFWEGPLFYSVSWQLDRRRERILTVKNGRILFVYDS